MFLFFEKTKCQNYPFLCFLKCFSVFTLFKLAAIVDKLSFLLESVPSISKLRNIGQPHKLYMSSTGELVHTRRRRRPEVS